jgi:hypothetical protein
MARASKRRRRLWDTYSFIGFRAEPIVRGIFGDPKARVITLRRRSKKRRADVAAGSRWAGTIARSARCGICPAGTMRLRPDPATKSHRVKYLRRGQSNQRLEPDMSVQRKRKRARKSRNNNLKADVVMRLFLHDTLTIRNLTQHIHETRHHRPKSK